MDAEELSALLEGVKKGDISPGEAALRLRGAPFADLGYARADTHRGIRQGANEVIFGQGKTPEQISGIARALAKSGAENILITRLSPESAAGISGIPLDYRGEARIGIAFPARRKEPAGMVVVASGGTSDIPVCEEAAVTCETLGSRTERLYDVGVAGLHRLLSALPVLSSARVIVAVAGMEGTLPGVIAGLVSCPVIAVPTDVGYGSSFGGLSALLAMLNSCSSGVSVVNINNGFGAGYIANMINKMPGLHEALGK